MTNGARGRASIATIVLTLIVGITFGTLMIGQSFGAATTAQTGQDEKVGWYVTYPVAIYWPISTDASDLIDSPAIYGHPIGYRHLFFQDQDLPAGGVAGTSTGIVANQLEHTFVDVEDQTNIESYQYTVLRQEFDGTAATQNSVVSGGEFIFTPFTDLFQTDL